MAKLNAKQAAFVREYLIDLNATQAAKRAGYKGNANTLGVVGYENLRNPKIRDEISKTLNDRAMSREEVIHRIGEQARGNMGDFVRLEQRVRPDFKLKTTEEGEVEWIEEVERYEVMELDLRAAKEAGKLGLVRKVKFDKDGGVSFELYSAQTALDMLAKAHGLYSDQAADDNQQGREYIEDLEYARENPDDPDAR